MYYIGLHGERDGKIDVIEMHVDKTHARDQLVELVLGIHEGEMLCAD